MEKDNKRKQIGAWLIEYEGIIRIVFYLLITIICTIFVIRNWCEVTTFTFFSNFNGRNLLFLVWIALLLLPILGSFEAFGLKMDFWGKQNKDALEKAKEEYERKIVETEQKQREIEEQSKKAGEGDV